MTRVCLVGDDEVNLRYELLSRETSRDALQTYDLRAPYENTVGMETVSLGAAVSLLNDLNWYIVRFVDEALVLEPSVSDEEWLSRDLAVAVRDDELAPGDSGRLLKVYGVERPDADGRVGEHRATDSAVDDDRSEERSGGSDFAGDDGDDSDGADGGDGGDGGDDDNGGGAGAGGDDGDSQLPRLVEPMLVTRTDDRIPEYDIRDVDDTVVVRVTESEFEGG